MIKNKLEILELHNFLEILFEKEAFLLGEGAFIQPLLKKEVD